MTGLERGLGSGSEFGGYRVEALVARGGMGVVYRAVQLALERTVALKVVAPELADDQDFRDRFKREALLAASLDHPNILPVYEAGEVDGHLFLAMRYVVGSDMDTLIRREGVLAPQRAVAIVAQIAGALDAAHSRGIVHRDVKPGNILIAQEYGEERAYLTDFGLTKNVATDARLTRTGQMVGTLDYVAPEQAQGFSVDGRADTYALACVLYQAVTGRVPFDRPSDAAKIWAHLNDQPPSAMEASVAVSADLDRVIRRGMAKQPADRFPSSGEFARAARDAVAGAPVTAAAAPPTQVDPTVVEPLAAAGPPTPAEAPAPAKASAPAEAPAPAKASAPADAPPPGPPAGRGERSGPARWVLYVAGAGLVLVVGAIIAIAAGGGGGRKAPTTAAGPAPVASTGTASAARTTSQTTTSTSAAAAQATAYHAQVVQIAPRLNAIFNHLPNGHDFRKPVFARRALADAAGVRGIADSLNALSPPPQVLTQHEALVAHLGEMEQALRSLAVDSDNRDFTSAYRDIHKLEAADRSVAAAVKAAERA